MTVSHPSSPRASPNGAVFSIIGGGIAGTVQAIFLAEKYPWLNIRIFEAKKEILSGTSSMNPGRPTFGFHYHHLATALFCQENTIKFAEFLHSIGCEHVFANAPQHGIYVLMKDTVQILGETIKPVNDSDEVKPIFEAIRCHAVKRYANDEYFQTHFGRPEKICRELPKEEYRRFITPEFEKGLGACYETTEKTFNMPYICLFLRRYIKKYKNITVLTEAKVLHLQKISAAKDNGYYITYRSGQDGVEHCEMTHLLTLACWERVGLFRGQLGKPESDPTYNRLKMLAILEVELDADDLDMIRPIFVASGAYSMISPQECIQKPDGRILCRIACTLAIITNKTTSMDNEPLPSEYNKLIYGTVSHDEKMALGKPILEGAKSIFTCLENARLADLRFGSIRVPFGDGGGVGLHDTASEHHWRETPGCQQLGNGLFVNEAMKVTYCIHNAKMILKWAQDDIERLRLIQMDGIHQRL